jgi:hypothetical protein
LPIRNTYSYGRFLFATFAQLGPIIVFILQLRRTPNLAMFKKVAEAVMGIRQMCK